MRNGDKHATGRLLRQHVTASWVRRAFGDGTMKALDERAARVLEEALELAQAAGIQQVIAERIVGYVFARPAGELYQEAGGVGITLLAFCEAAGFSADRAESDELGRVLKLPIEHFLRRQAEKRAALATPGIRTGDRIEAPLVTPARPEGADAEAALRAYWNARTPEDESAARVLMRAAGFPDDYVLTADG